MLAGRLNTANTASPQLDTDAIAAASRRRVLSGRRTIWVPALGALLISTIRNGLNPFSAGNDIQYIVIGL